MSNNIYDILKKINSLEQPKSVITESAKGCKVCGMKNCKCEDKKHESKKKDKKDKGAIAEAVAKVEQQLNEKYMGFKKSAAAKKMGEELDPKYKTPNWDAHQERMKDPNIRSFSQQQDANSSSPGASYGAYSADERGQQAYKDRTSGGIINKVKDTFGWDKPDPAYGPRDTKVKEDDANEDVLTPKQKKFAKLAPPPDKITYADKIAGAKKGQKDEGNEFSGALAKAKAQHKDKFTVGGKTYPVKEGFPTVADAKKRMDDREGKTSHGKKTVTKSGVKHERDYDAVDKGADVDTAPKGRGRPKKDKFAK